MGKPPDPRQRDHAARAPRRRGPAGRDAARVAPNLLLLAQGGPILAQTHVVVAPDLRGFGDTEKPAAGYDKRTVARDIRELLARLGHRRAVIVGHDIGAQIAFRLALDAPDLVAKLVIVNGRYPPLGTALMYTPKHAPERWYSTSSCRSRA